MMLNQEKELLEKATPNGEFPQAFQGDPNDKEEGEGQIDNQKLHEEKNTESTDVTILKDTTSPVKTNVRNPCDSEDSDDEANALDIEYDEYESEDDDAARNDVFEVSTEDGGEQWKKVEIKQGYENTEIVEKPLIVTNPLIIDDLYISDDSEDDDDPELRHYLSSGCRSWADQKQKDQRPVTDVSLDNDVEEFSNDAEEINDLTSSSGLPDDHTLMNSSQEKSSLVEVQVSLSTDYEDDIEKDSKEEKNHGSEESEEHISMSTSIKETGRSDFGGSVHAPLFTDGYKTEEQEKVIEASLSTGTDDKEKIDADAEKGEDVFTGKDDIEKDYLNAFVEEKDDVERNHNVEDRNDDVLNEEMQYSLSAYSEELERDAVKEGGSTPVHDVWNDFGIEETDQELLNEQFNLDSTQQVCSLLGASVGEETAFREFQSTDLDETSKTTEEW